MGEYTMGRGKMPEWVACKVMAYKKTDGSTGYEFYGMVKVIDLRIGDKIIKEGHLIRIERKGRRFELKRGKRLFKPDKAAGQNCTEPEKAKGTVA